MRLSNETTRFARRVVSAPARDRIPAAFGNIDAVAVGGLMSYGTDIADMFRQVGVYTGSILEGAKPTDLPVLQATKFEFRHQPTNGASARQCHRRCSLLPTR